jgi:hypothetical protein
MVLFVKSSSAYDESDDLIYQQFGLNLPSYYDRFVRTTKFPRIGRSSDDVSSSLIDMNTSSEENNDDDDELRLIEQRSVMFPRIGKRAFHNLLWANSRSNPHRMIDAQGRSYLTGYDYHLNQVRPQSLSRYRGKRNVIAEKM